MESPKIGRIQELVDCTNCHTSSYVSSRKTENESTEPSEMKKFEIDLTKLQAIYSNSYVCRYRPTNHLSIYPSP